MQRSSGFVEHDRETLEDVRGNRAAGRGDVIVESWRNRERLVENRACWRSCNGEVERHGTGR